MSPPTEIPTPPEIMMSVPESNAIMQLVLQFMRNQADQSTRIEDRLSGTDTLLLDVRERLIRIEQADHAAQIRAAKDQLALLEGRLKKLEDDARERVGMQKLVDWVTKFGWMILFALAFVVIFGMGKAGL